LVAIIFLYLKLYRLSNTALRGAYTT